MLEYIKASSIFKEIFICKIHIKNNKLEIKVNDFEQGHNLDLSIKLGTCDKINDNSYGRIFTSYKGIKFYSQEFISWIIDNMPRSCFVISIDYGFDNTIEYLKINRDSITVKAKKEFPIVLRNMITIALEYLISALIEDVDKLKGLQLPENLYNETLFYAPYEDLDNIKLDILKEFFIINNNSSVTKDISFKPYIQSTNNNSQQFLYPIIHFDIKTHSDEKIYTIKFTKHEDYVKIQFDANNIKNLQYFLIKVCKIDDLILPLERYSSLCVPFTCKYWIFDKYKLYINPIFNQGGFIPITFNRPDPFVDSFQEIIIEYIELLAYSRKIFTMQQKRQIALDIYKLINDMYKVENNDINTPNYLDFEKDIYTKEFQETLENIELHQYEE